MRNDSLEDAKDDGLPARLEPPEPPEKKTFSAGFPQGTGEVEDGAGSTPDHREK
jgi:hypothetical protein